MAAGASKIEWTDATWNPGRGCSRVSPGCDNCYAMKVAYRFKGPGLAYEGLATLRKNKADWTGVVREVPDDLDTPLRWRKPKRIFVNSQTDLFHHGFSNEFIASVFGVMAACPQHTFQVLTKRAERMREWFEWLDRVYERNALPWKASVCRFEALAHGIPEKKLPEPRHGYGWPLPNVQLGVSVENQKYADERIPYLLDTPAAVRFLSAEPLLGFVDLSKEYLTQKLGKYPFPTLENEYRTKVIDLLDWVIVGGESGVDARPMHPDWARMIREQCNLAGVPFFFKQWGAWRPRDEGDNKVRRIQFLRTDGVIGTDEEFARGQAVALDRVGKKRAGRILDGRTWDEQPEAA